MIAIVLGSGMNTLIDYVEIVKAIEYKSFTKFNIIPLEGHDRILYEAKINGKSLIILSGKLHMYEGYNYDQSISPLQYVNENYSIDRWIITSASGALSENMTVGMWQEVSDIFSLDNIKGLNSSKSFSTISNSKRTTYAYQKGPALGTVGEYKMLSKLGTDLVGMSMLPEYIYLNSINANTNLYSLPVCTYHPISYAIKEPSHEQVITIAEAAVSKLVAILSTIISTN